MRATIHLRQSITDDDLRRVSEENPGWQVERAADGSLLMSPTSMSSSARNVELAFQMAAFAKRAGGKSFGPDCGFTMPSGAVLSPDACWVREEVWAQLSPEDRDSFSRIVPAICIELRSRTDGVRELQRKIRTYREAGAEYALLIDPYARRVWSDGAPPEGFDLDVAAIFDA